MRYILTLLFCIALPTVATCQNYSRFQLGIIPGFTVTGFSNSKITVAGGSIQFKMGWSLKHIEVFTGTGLLLTASNRRLADESGAATRICPTYLMVNYKADMTNESQFFCGGYAGISHGSGAGFDLMSAMYGLQAGCIFNVSNKIDVEVAESWRQTRLDDVYFENSSNQYVKFYSTFNINYFTTSIGIRVKFLK